MFCRQTSIMPEVNPTRTMAFASSGDLSEWLKANHATESELWVKVSKKKSGVPSVTWDDVVTETLCWGWIDGIKKSFDDQAYLQRITPRTDRSRWSKRNTEHVARLTAEGRMEEPGLLCVRDAKADGRWEAAYPPPSETEVPADFLAALEDRPEAKRFFETLNKSSRYTIALGLTDLPRLPRTPGLGYAARSATCCS